MRRANYSIRPALAHSFPMSVRFKLDARMENGDKYWYRSEWEAGPGKMQLPSAATPRMPRMIGVQKIQPSLKRGLMRPGRYTICNVFRRLRQTQCRTNIMTAIPTNDSTVTPVPATKNSYLS